MKAAERNHIASVGEKKFQRAVGAAMLNIRQDARLIGLDKIRLAMAEQAAFKATGFKIPCFAIPKGAGEIRQDIIDVCSEVFDRATEAAALSLQHGK